MASGRSPGHVGGQRLSAFLDDELDDDDALALTAHVTGCPTCRVELEALRATRTAVRALPPLRGLPGVQAPVLTTEVRGLRHVRSWSRRVIVVSGIAAVVLVLGAAAYVAGSDGGEVVPPVERFLLDHLARTGDGPVPAPLGGPSR